MPDLCEDYGCIIGCLPYFYGYATYFLRQKDDRGERAAKEKTFTEFLYCPDCGKKVAK